jgi:hypothetical protein
MNKKRKLLTLVALVVFSGIIALHYYKLPLYRPSHTHILWTQAKAPLSGSEVQYNQQHPLNPNGQPWRTYKIVLKQQQQYMPGYWDWTPASPVMDVHMPLFVLSVLYAGCMAVASKRRAQ